MKKLLVNLFVAAVFIFLLLPIVYIVLVSFMATPVFAYPPSGFTLHWYQSLSPEFFDSLKVSVLVALGAAVLSAILGTLTALAVVRGSFPGRGVLMQLSTAPVAVPAVVIGVALYQAGLVVWGLTGVEVVGSLWGLVLAHTILGIPFVVRAVVASHGIFDVSQEEAALNLGASVAVTFRRVSLRGILSGIAAGTVLAFLVSFDDLPVALFIAPSDAPTFPLKIFTTIEFSFTHDVMVVSSIVIMLSFVLMGILEWLVGLDKIFGSEVR